jgi:hypothetical protein
MVKSLNVGDKVRYLSAAGEIVGEVSDFFMRMNGRDELIPWVVIRYKRLGKEVTATLAATESYFKIMRFEKIA